VSDDKITRLPVQIKGTPRVLKLAPTYVGCQHLHAIVDEKLTELECRDCGAKLNPIAYLANMARTLGRWDWERDRIEKARASLAERSKCRCTKCGEWTEIRTVHRREVARIKSNTPPKGAQP